MPDTSKAPKSKRMRRILLPVIVLAGAVLVATIIIATKPKPKKKQIEKQRYMVETVTAAKTNKNVTIDVTGTVIPAKQIDLKPQVSGRIEKLAHEFEPGGYLKKGQTAVFIDPVDHEINLTQKQSELAKAELDYQLEAGRQLIAKQEWELLKDSSDSALDRSLALRQPHLKSAKAALSAAKSKLAQAALDLERTQVKAPFNCVVLNKNADTGSLVNSQTQLATLAGTDEFWIQVSLPVDRIKWIRFPTPAAPQGSSAEISQKVGLKTVGTHQGNVYRLLGNLESQGRMARLIISVSNPLYVENGSTPLLLGSYVQAQIAGESINNVFALPRQALKDGKYIYIASKEDTLEIRQIQPVWKDKKQFFITKGLKNGERVITSEISTPVEGRLLLVTDKTSVKQSKSGKAGAGGSK